MGGIKKANKIKTISEEFLNDLSGNSPHLCTRNRKFTRIKIKAVIFFSIYLSMLTLCLLVEYKLTTFFHPGVSKIGYPGVKSF